MTTLPLTAEIIGVLSILVVAICLFTLTRLRVDVTAMLIMILIGLSSLLPNYDGLVNTTQLFKGYSSNAVISIIAVMIIGAGLDRTGIMGHLAGKILKMSGTTSAPTESRVITLISAIVGVISSFIQNIGAASLFLPVANRIARQGNLAISRLLMPIGFCAILGGTATMIGSSPLILLNDLLISSNQTLPADLQMRPFSLFAVTPIGIALLIVGIAYFVFCGRFVLPEIKHKPGESGSMLKYFKEVYGIEGEVYECRVTKTSLLLGKTLSDVDAAGRAGWIIAIRSGGQVIVAPGGDTEFSVDSDLAIMGRRDDVTAFAEEHQLTIKKELNVFGDVLSTASSGIAEIVIMPDSNMIGKSIKDAQIRRRYGATVLAVFRVNDVIDRDLSQIVMQSGDTLVVHIRWGQLLPIAENRHDFAVVTDFPREDSRPKKLKYAVGFFILTLGLVLFTDMRLSLALMTGAVGMILSGVIKIDEAYRAIGWQSVFLLASLIPLGIAMQESGTAAWIAHHTLGLLGDVQNWVWLVTLAVLSTIFTLLLSNVGATVLLVPLAINLAVAVGANPATFALTVALATSNSFLIPTHQVNALIMGPGGYKVADFLKAGSIMTLLFIIVIVVGLSIFY